MDSATASEEIAGHAAALRAIDPSVEALTLAYPYCATNSLIDRITARESLIARTCGGTARFAWQGAPSNWLRMTSFIASDAASAPAALNGIDAAAGDSSWFLTLNHGVSGDWMAVTTAQVDSMFDRAKGRDLWIGTYQEVAAYWRAAKVLDTATTRTSGNGWSLRWKSPHPRMPRRVPVRIRLDSATFGTAPQVLQAGNAIQPNGDGTWNVDFMQLSLQILPTNALSLPQRSAQRPRIERTSTGLRLTGLAEGGTWSAHALDGQSLERGTLSPDGSGSQHIKLGTSGAQLLTLATASGTQTVRIVVTK